ncbi:MAG TPA: tripartite tricarboxylate transporter substrate binding protein [Xanthobacteraceae bacterium]|nr:tripartite tricarboxylate transporter substrate binding protein [Xanthobacteraceae bacterium]
MTSALPFSRRHLLVSLTALAACATSSTGHAQSWPQKPVRVMVGFAAGGNIDNLARLTCQRLSDVLGQQFVVENRVGAMGTIAAESVVRAQPDGYTLFWAGTGTVSIFPAIGKPPYDTVKDFTPVSMIGTSPQVLIVNPKLPVKTVQEFVAYVKAQPQKMPYAGGGGPGSVSNLLMALFLKRAGIEMTAVSYRGTAPALADLIGGHIPTMFVPLPEAIHQAEAGKIRILAISDDKRSPQVPNVPTIAESGYPGYRGVSWNGLFAPAGTPWEIVDRLAAEFQRAVKDPQFSQALVKQGVTPTGMTPEQFAAFLKQDMAFWDEAVKVAGVTLKQ